MNRFAAALCVVGAGTLVHPCDAQGACPVADCYDFEYAENTCIRLSWPPSKIPVHIVVNAAGTPDISFTSYTGGAFQAVADAFRTWSRVNLSYFRYVEDGVVSQTVTRGDDGLNLIIWRDSTWPRDYDPSAIAVTTTWYELSTGTIRNSDMELNGVNFQWRVVGPANCLPARDKNVVDVQNIVTHESGHILGLGHPPTTCTDTTMYYASTSCETKKRELASADVTGISTLYPARLTIASVLPNSALNNTGATLTISGSGFQSGAAVTLTLDHRPDVTAEVMSVTSNSLFCALTLTGASVGKWTVWVTHPGADQGKLFEGFTVGSNTAGIIFTPAANAGVSNSVIAGTKVVLDGSKSYDPNGAQLSYSWSISAAPEQVTLSNPDTAYPSFTPRTVGSYGAALVVSNTQYSSTPSSVTITVTGAPGGSGGGNGCGCAIQRTGHRGAIPGIAFFWCLPFVYVVFKKRRSRRIRQPGRNPR